MVPRRFGQTPDWLCWLQAPSLSPYMASPLAFATLCQPHELPLHLLAQQKLHGALPGCLLWVCAAQSRAGTGPELEPLRVVMTRDDLASAAQPSGDLPLPPPHHLWWQQAGHGTREESVFHPTPEILLGPHILSSHSRPSFLHLYSTQHFKRPSGMLDTSIPKVIMELEYPNRSGILEAQSFF